MNFYTLKDKKPVQMSSFNLEEMKYIQDPKNRVVRQTEFTNGEKLSTVFLMVDHGWGEGDPILFETMLLGNNGDDILNRYCTWNEAEAGHIKFVNQLIESGSVVVKNEAKSSIEDELEEIDRFELMDFD